MIGIPLSFITLTNLKNAENDLINLKCNSLYCLNFVFILFKIAKKY